MAELDAFLRERVAKAQSSSDPDQRPFRSLVSARQYALLYQKALETLPAGARVLDWGAGSGHFSSFLAQAGYDVTAYSLDPAMPEWLDERARFVAGRLDEPTRLPFAHRSFDAVVSVGVLEHVRETGGDERSSLRELRRVLVPGGKLLIYHLPNRNSWIEAAASLSPDSHHHAYRYRSQELRELLASAGLRLEETRRYGFLPRNSLHGLPAGLADSMRFADLWDALDALLARVASPICQNHLLIGRKP